MLLPILQHRQDVADSGIELGGAVHLFHIARNHLVSTQPGSPENLGGLMGRRPNVELGGAR